jgi:signal-transduction protein with cAMP-binding, CBS, and nucleotidyltransferase domain
MRRRNIHSLVVNLSVDKPSYGIVTTTDIRDKIIASGNNPAETRIREIMTAPVSVADPGCTLMECAREMQKLSIHHMPVVDEHNLLIGLISVTDIFRAAEEIGWGSKG